MADDVDLAQAQEEAFLRHAVSVARQGVGYDDDPLIIDGFRFCLDCEKRIPMARLKANQEARRCVACQDKFEKNYGKEEHERR